MRLEITENLINDDEILFLKDLTKNFVRSTDMGTLNVDNRMVIRDEKRIASYLLNVNEFLKKLPNQYEIAGDIWMTNVDKYNIALNDEYHLDMADVSVVTYFDNDFTGGEFEYIDNDNKVNIIYPKPKLTIVMQDKTYHRVKNVNSGIRYSLTTFYNLKEKKSKTFL